MRLLKKAISVINVALPTNPGDGMGCPALWGGYCNKRYWGTW